MPPRVLKWACLAGALLVAACSPAKTPPEDDEAAASSQAALDADLGPAFFAAFHMPAPAPHEIERQGQKIELQYSPALLADLGDGRLALVSKGEAAEGGGGLAVHYLHRSGDKFSVLGQGYDLCPVSGAGVPGPEARVRRNLFDRPALQAEVAERKMGCEIAAASLYELLPAGPALRAQNIVTMRNNIPMGAMRTGPQVDYYGNILPDEKGKGFKVRYHGSHEGDVAWAPGAGGTWAAQAGRFKPPEC